MADTKEKETSDEKSAASATAEPFIATVREDDHESIDILKTKAKKKPYHAIMRILLFMWPVESRQKVVADLKELRKLDNKSDQYQYKVKEILRGSEPTRLVWENLNVNTYYSYVNRHKSYVRTGYNLFNDLIVNVVKPRLHREGQLLAEYYPEQDPTDDQIDIHDDSKYSFVETVTYAMKWYPCCGMGQCDDEAWETGLQHHYNHNEHHPEFWGSRPMEWRFIVESLYDMSAMELEKRFAGNVPQDGQAYKLLEFNEQFLQRFRMTGQFELIRKLSKYTIEAYKSLHSPGQPSASASLLN